MSNDQPNPAFINMPLLLSSNVLVQAPTGEMVQDEGWHERVKARVHSLLCFLYEKDLLVQDVDQRADIASLVLRKNDFNDTGQALWKTGAIHKWLNSFDQKHDKSLSDFKALERALAKVRSAKQ